MGWTLVGSVQHGMAAAEVGSSLAGGRARTAPSSHRSPHVTIVIRRARLDAFALPHRAALTNSRRRECSQSPELGATHAAVFSVAFSLAAGSLLSAAGAASSCAPASVFLLLPPLARATLVSASEGARGGSLAPME